jgi:hypothetical protein
VGLLEFSGVNFLSPQGVGACSTVCALEHGHWALPDLIDSLLRWAEQVEQDAILSLPWSDATPTA